MIQETFMKKWSELFLKYLIHHFPSPTVLRERFHYVETIVQHAAQLFNHDSFFSMPPEKIYEKLNSIQLPECSIRMTNLGRMNEAGHIVEKLYTLVSTAGDFETRMNAAKFPQAGVVTLSAILCVARPRLFILRNTPLTKALSKVVPFYSARALTELGYSEFLDICNELSNVLEEWANLPDIVTWIRSHRFTLLYCILVNPSGIQ